jgi:hypothetical protein
MTARFDFNSPCTILFVGTFFMVIAAGKGIIYFVFPTLYLTGICTVVSIIYLLQNFVLAYYTLFATPYIGLYLKTLAAISIWVPLVLWVPFVFFASLFTGIGVGFGYPFVATFDDKDLLLWSGAPDAFKLVHEFAVKCLDFNKEGFKNTMDDYIVPTDNNPKQFEIVNAAVGIEVQKMQKQQGVVIPEAEKIVPFDIPLHVLVWCLFVGMICMLYLGSFCTVILLVKLVPILFHGYYRLWELYFVCESNFDCTAFSWRIFFFVPFVIAHPLWLVLGVIGCLVCCVASFLYGAKGMFDCYREGAVEAFSQTRLSIVDANKKTNELLPACLVGKN